MLSMWTIYDHPADHPNHFIAREYRVERGRYVATKNVHTAERIETLRKMMLERGLICITRDKRDDPIIVETWL